MIACIEVCHYDPHNEQLLPPATQCGRGENSLSYRTRGEFAKAAKEASGTAFCTLSDFCESH